MSVAIAVKLFKVLSKGRSASAIFLRELGEDGYKSLVKSMDAKDLKRLTSYGKDSQGVANARKMAHGRGLKKQASDAPLFNQPKGPSARDRMRAFEDESITAGGAGLPSRFPKQTRSIDDVMADLADKEDINRVAGIPDMNSRRGINDIVDGMQEQQRQVFAGEAAKVQARQAPLPNAGPRAPGVAPAIDPEKQGVILDAAGQAHATRRTKRLAEAGAHPRKIDPELPRYDNFGRKMGRWARKGRPDHVYETFKKGNKAVKAGMLIGGADVATMAIPGGLHVLANTKVGQAIDRGIGGDEELQEMQSLMQQVQADSLKRQYKNSLRQQNIEENAISLARNAPDVYQMVMAGRMLPNGSTSIGGRRRVDLLEQVAAGMGEGRGIPQRPNPDDFLNQIMGGGVM